jgi:hypothetical protein
VSFLEFIGVLVLWVWFWSLADVVGSEGVGGASLLFRRWATKKAGGFCSCGFPCGCGRSRILLTFSQAGGRILGLEGETAIFLPNSTPLPLCRNPQTSCCVIWNLIGGCLFLEYIHMLGSEFRVDLYEDFLFSFMMTLISTHADVSPARL